MSRQTSWRRSFTRGYAWPQSGMLQTGGRRLTGHLRYLDTPRLKLHTRLFGAPAILNWVVTESDRCALPGRWRWRRVGRWSSPCASPACPRRFHRPRPPSCGVAGRARLLARGGSGRWRGPTLDRGRARSPGAADPGARAAPPFTRGARRSGCRCGRDPSHQWHTPLVAGGAFRRARHARAFMIYHADRPISLPKLAAALDVGNNRS